MLRRDRLQQPGRQSLWRVLVGGGLVALVLIVAMNQALFARHSNAGGGACDAACMRQVLREFAREGNGLAERQASGTNAVYGGWHSVVRPLIDELNERIVAGESKFPASSPKKYFVQPSDGSAPRPYGNVVEFGYPKMNRAANLFFRSAVDTQVERICEIGFAGGHSAVLYLSANANAEYVGFDLMKRAYNDVAAAVVREMFPGRVTIVEGDSTVAVPRWVAEHGPGGCDLIIVDGAHHGDTPLVDMRNMAQLASCGFNRLLADDCNERFPPVLTAWQSLVREGLIGRIHDRDTFVNKACVGYYRESAMQHCRSDSH